VYALPPLGLDGDPVPPTVEQMAAAQRAVIRRIRPTGPYFLGGFCFSGLIALEVARQLRAEGEQVELVATIETRVHPPIFLNRAANRVARLAARLRGASVHEELALAGRLRPLVYRAMRFYESGHRQQVRRLASAVRHAARVLIDAALWRRTPPGPAAAPAPAVPAPHGAEAVRASVLKATQRAFDGFVPRRYDGAIVCAWAEEESFEPAAWQRVGPNVSLQPLPGNHNTCITTRINALGTWLDGALADAQHKVKGKR
jgi:thioesterase domain-containing protein